MKKTKKTRIYLAASLFTPFDRERNVQIANLLKKAGFEVLLPQNIKAPTSPNGIELRPVYDECVRQLDLSDIILAIVDGAEVDTGVAWELGYAFARKKQIICLRTDYRLSESNGVNIMIEFSATELIYVKGYKNTISDVFDKLIETLQNKVKLTNNGSEILNA